VEVVASLSQGRTAAAQCGLFTYKSVPVIFEPPCITRKVSTWIRGIINKQLLEKLGTNNLFKGYAFYKSRVNVNRRGRGQSIFWHKNDRNFKRNLSRKMNRQICE